MPIELLTSAGRIVTLTALSGLLVLSQPGSVEVLEVASAPPLVGEALLQEGGAGALLLESGGLLLVESGVASPISALTSAGALTGDELLAVVQGGATRKLTLDDLTAWLVGEVS